MSAEDMRKVGRLGRRLRIDERAGRAFLTTMWRQRWRADRCTTTRLAARKTWRQRVMTGALVTLRRFAKASCALPTKMLRRSGPHCAAHGRCCTRAKEAEWPFFPTRARLCTFARGCPERRRCSVRR